MKEFWNQLSPTRRAGLAAGVTAIVVMTVAFAYWTAREEYVPVVTHASPDRLAVSVREIEKLKVPYRVSKDGTSLEVPANQVGRVKMGVATGGSGGGNVGFEIFNSTDFSTTEFTQKVNYQRALQGELSRTIASIEGVGSARVHLVLGESGFGRREPIIPTAAVTIGLQPGVALTSQQVMGIQRIVAASVPEIKLKDIAVLDQSGDVLTKNTTGTDAGPASKSLELKREVDSYFEAKLRKLLGNLDPKGEFNVSVDATLNTDDVKVTTEDVLPGDSGGGRASGVLVRERQSHRQESAASTEGLSASGPSSGSVTHESEYRVGRRIEQVATAPGNIERVSVAVIARGALGSLDELRVKDLVAHAIGANDERGDSVAVVFLPAISIDSTFQNGPQAAAAKGNTGSRAGDASLSKRVTAVLMVLCVLALALLGFTLLTRSPKDKRKDAAAEPSVQELDEIVDRVKIWLDEGKPHASA